MKRLILILFILCLASIKTNSGRDIPLKFYFEKTEHENTWKITEFGIAISKEKRDRLTKKL